MKKPILALAMLCGFAIAAEAHQVWIEQPSGEAAIVRFGEFGENLREVSPGLLDMFGKPAATLVSVKGETPVTVTKSADGFALSASPGRSESLIAEDTAFPLRKLEQGGEQITSWYWPGARYVVGMDAQQPRLSLDITPTGKAGEFLVTFKGQPLPKVEVGIRVQSGWGKQVHSDEHGLVRFAMPWKGQYVIEASHVDRTPGERPGASGPEKYDGINHVSTLAFVKPDGAEPAPAGPVAAPSK